MFPRVILNGTLVKKSQQKKKMSPENYKERFFVLDTKELRYSERRQKNKPVFKGSVELSKIKFVGPVTTDLEIPCHYKFPFQVFYDNTYLYIFTPDNNCREQWVSALKDETKYNESVTEYHPGMWMQGKWRCCNKTDRLAIGCLPYDRGTKASKKVPPRVPDRKAKQFDTDSRTVIAIQDFDKGDLPLHKDQKYVLIENSDFDWWMVQDSEGKQGFVPSICVAGKSETNFKRFEWYNSNISRKTCHDLLSKVGKEGAFMVRKSHKPGHYTVSVYSDMTRDSEDGNPNVWDYLIKQNRDTESPFHLADDRLFTTIPGLVHYHQHNSAGLVTRLRHPISHEKRFSMGFQDTSEGQWQLNPLELTLEETLGSGQFGLVMGGKWRKKKVAVKMIKEGSMSEEAFKEEAKVMMKLCHCKLVCLYGVCTQRSPMCLVFEFMEKGALLDYLKARKGDFSRRKLLGMCLDVCEGMHYLETSNFIHRDLAARNCLVSHDGVVKVADFGMARFLLDNEYTSSQGVKFPVRWSAVEVIYQGRYSTKSDVWSFGVLAWEIYSKGCLPYEKLSNNKVMEFVRKGSRLSQPDLSPDEVYSLMKWCWKEEPDDRPTFALLLHDLARISKL